jgi:hypothetical protein
MNIQTIFPRKWLYAEDLQGKAVTVQIAGATLEQLRNPRTNKDEAKLVVAFAKATKRLVCNKTQAYAIAAAVGNQDTDGWIGRKVTLSAAIAPNGKQTILITPVAGADHNLDAGAGADAAGADHNPDPDPDANPYPDPDADADPEGDE